MEIHDTQLGKIDKKACFVWIDRSYKGLQSIKQKLDSYLFEPTTYSQYEEKEQITAKMEAVEEGHLELLTLLKSGKNILKDHLTKVRHQLKEAKRLEESINRYIMMTHSKV
ncbi:hypothetical protein [Maribacter thermophilus]|uniref:hypothetical protein n=1 Tax=Maribacter thermophilus TaxID=1197874 RepID=UPI0012F866F0|nr:hypothetical protein [Maribacter thermophilus]